MYGSMWVCSPATTDAGAFWKYGNGGLADTFGYEYASTGWYAAVGTVKPAVSGSATRVAEAKRAS